MKDTYLTSEDEIFTLVTLMMVEEDVLELPLGWSSFKWKILSSIEKGFLFWWGIFAASLDELFLGQGEDHFLLYNFENGDTAFLPSTHFNFSCSVD